MIPLSRNGSDIPRSDGIVVESSADLCDTDIESAFKIYERLFAPDGLPQLFTRDHFSRLRDQVRKDARRLRLQANQHTLAAKLTIGRFEREEAEAKSARVDWRWGGGNGATSAYGYSQNVFVEQSVVASALLDVA